VEHPCRMGNPLEWITRGCRGRRGAFGGGAARWWADVAGERCPANAVVFGLSSLAQKGGMGSGVLTELGFEGEGRAKSMAMLTGGGAGTVIAGGVRRPFSGRLAAGFNSWRRWGEEQGVRGLQDPTAASNCSGVDSPAGMASGRKSQRGVAKTLELWSQGGSRGLGEAAARLMAVWGAAGRHVATAAPCSALTERGERRLGFAGRRVSG